MTALFLFVIYLSTDWCLFWLYSFQSFDRSVHILKFIMRVIKYQLLICLYLVRGRGGNCHVLQSPPGGEGGGEAKRGSPLHAACPSYHGGQAPPAGLVRRTARARSVILCILSLLPPSSSPLLPLPSLTLLLLPAHPLYLLPHSTPRSNSKHLQAAIIIMIITDYLWCPIS